MVRNHQNVLLPHACLSYKYTSLLTLTQLTVFHQFFKCKTYLVLYTSLVSQVSFLFSLWVSNRSSLAISLTFWPAWLNDLKLMYFYSLYQDLMLIPSLWKLLTRDLNFSCFPMVFSPTISKELSLCNRWPTRISPLISCSKNFWATVSSKCSFTHLNTCPQFQPGIQFYIAL